MLVFGNNVHPVEENRLDGVLPGPQRQGVIAERAVVRIQHERWEPMRRHCDRHFKTSLALEPIGADSVSPR